MLLMVFLLVPIDVWLKPSIEDVWLKPSIEDVIVACAARNVMKQSRRAKPVGIETSIAYIWATNTLGAAVWPEAMWVIRCHFHWLIPYRIATALRLTCECSPWRTYHAPDLLLYLPNTFSRPPFIVLAPALKRSSCTTSAYTSPTSFVSPALVAETLFSRTFCHWWTRRSLSTSQLRRLRRHICMF